MSGIQKLIAIGNLGKDPETFNGGSRFSIAVSEKWKDKNSGEQREATEWINCVAFGKTGEIAAQYLHKGSKVYIEGKLKTDSYEKEGVKHWSTSVVVRELQFLDSRGDSAPASGGQAGGSHDPDGDIPFAALNSRAY